MDGLIAPQWSEQNTARLEQQAEAAESKAAEFDGKLAALRERLDDLVIQIGQVQTDLDAGEIEEAQACLQDLWLILHAVDRRFRDLLQ